MRYSHQQIASICDHTFLKRSEGFSSTGNESKVQLRKKAFESFLINTLSLKFSPYAVCVRPEDVQQARVTLPPHILICSVVGFPDGAHYSTDFKLQETKLALHYGAKEVDMVLNYEYLQQGLLQEAALDIQTVVTYAHEKGAKVKCILEVSELSSSQIETACQIAEKTGCDFVKTSTGFSSSGATFEALRVIARSFPRGIKISGGVTAANVNSLLQAASRHIDGRIDFNPHFIRIGESSLLETWQDQ